MSMLQSVYEGYTNILTCPPFNQCCLPFLLSGLALTHTHIWWFTMGSEEVRGLYSRCARYSLKQSTTNTKTATRTTIVSEVISNVMLWTEAHIQLIVTNKGR